MTGIERTVIVHPHIEHDVDCTCVPYLDGVVSKAMNGHILILQGFKQDEHKNLTDEQCELYITCGTEHMVLPSVHGEIEESELEGFVTDNSTVRLLGGIVGQCHREAFVSIINYIENNDIFNVTFVIPYDGCYFQHEWTQWGWDLEYRFDGVFIGGYGYEMEGGDSYTLREVVKKRFGKLEGPNELHRRQLRDPDGKPLVADIQEIRKNLVEYFFIGYFALPHGQKIVTRKYEVSVDNDCMKIHVH